MTFEQLKEMWQLVGQYIFTEQESLDTLSSQISHKTCSKLMVALPSHFWTAVDILKSSSPGNRFQVVS